MLVTSSTKIRYAELHSHSAFTFLDGVSQPEELVYRAQDIGLEALAVLDIDGMYSAVQVNRAARTHAFPIVHGSELTVELSGSECVSGEFHRGWGLESGAHDPGVRLPILARSPDGYTQLCRAMSEHCLRHPGRRQVAHPIDELAQNCDWFILTGTARGPLRRALIAEGMAGARRMRDGLIELFGSERVGIESALMPSDSPQLADDLASLARERNLPLVATTAARAATAQEHALGDVLTATRLRMTLEEAQAHLPALRAFLRSGEEMAYIHRRHPHALGVSAEIAQDIAFDMRLIAPHLPTTKVPRGHTDVTWLRELTIRGAVERYGERHEDPHAWRVIDHELDVIESLGFSGYFLIVKEIIDFCNSRGILAQGRGSAANSAVCFSLGITHVDAVRHQLLFERFLSPERSEAPDIDVDIESGRREEVIQHVYELYGREHAAQVANVLSYKTHMAFRDAAAALGYAPGLAQVWARGDRECPPLVRTVAQSLRRLPRHMGTHPGGMVLTREPVSWICPVTWSATPSRTVLQWDKEDCADAGLVKFDLLGLGTLTALRRAFTWLKERGVTGKRGAPIGLHTLPEEDPRVYDLLCAADTVGVFQVESRAQMNTLPRLAPRCFYDIVIEVALIRPGPIQGKAVNPYLRRRQGREPVTYMHPLAKDSLEKTLGVPLFQEQLMRLAVDIAGFTPAQSSQLRQAMGSKRSHERMEVLRPALMNGMKERGVDKEARERVFNALKGFSDFGFPESHAFACAHIVYASAWIKVHYPEHFYAALLSSQPVGFYSPASLVHDARLHGVRIGGVDVNDSELSACVRPYEGNEEPPQGERRAFVDVSGELMVRLGLEEIRGVGGAASRIVTSRITDGPFQSLSELAQRARLSRKDLEKLASAGALESLGVSRREGLWTAGVVGQEDWVQPFIPGTECIVQVPDVGSMSPAQEMVADYRALGLSPQCHPFELLRSQLEAEGVRAVSSIGGALCGSVVSVAGIVTHRQRPPTAGGMTFISLEDETGLINVSCSQGVWERWKQCAVFSRALVVRGRVEWVDGAVNIKAHHMSEVEMSLSMRSRDFR